MSPRLEIHKDDALLLLLILLNLVLPLVLPFIMRTTVLVV
jgi:hypothetical protein